MVVAENRLGVLNHLTLTVLFLRSAGLSLLGVVLNDRSPDPSPARERNEEEVRRIAGDRYLGRVPHGARVLPEAILSGLVALLPP
jgi:dethiobiotin synthetase